MSRRLAAPALLCALLVATPPAFAAKDTFTAVMIDHPYGENFFEPLGLNDRGQVVASVHLPDDSWWITGPNGRDYVEIYVPFLTVQGMGGINDAGTAVGTYWPAGTRTSHAFVTDWSGAIVDIHPTAAAWSTAQAIDDAGRVAGQGAFPQGVRAFVTSADRSRVRVLGTLGGASSYAWSFRKGVVVGVSDTADGASHAFRAQGPDGRLVDLGTLGGVGSVAFGVNTRGQVAGVADDASGASQAFVTAADGVTLQAIASLGPTHGLGAPSFAWGLNTHGNVVGTAWDAAKRRNKAFVTGVDGHGMVDLNRLTRLHPGSWLDHARAINDRGEILAKDHLDEGLLWLLVPTRPTWREELEDDARTE